MSNPTEQNYTYCQSLISHKINIKLRKYKKMNKNKILTITAIVLVILGIIMIYLGGFHSPKVILPPIITGIGFFFIAWAVNAVKNK